METCRFVHLKRNGGDGTSFPLMRESTLILGRYFASAGCSLIIKTLTPCRDPECDFRVQVPSVSDKHAKLVVDKSGKVN